MILMQPFAGLITPDAQLGKAMQESIDSHLVQVMESIIMLDDDPISGEQPLLAYAASSDPDILTLSQAMKAPDHEEF